MWVGRGATDTSPAPAHAGRTLPRVAISTTRLRTALDDLLKAATATLTDPPDRRYVAHGQPAIDCEQLVVHCAGVRSVTLEQPGDIPSPRPQPRVRVATLVATLSRPVCATPQPTAAQLGQDGRALAVDGWSLVAGLIEALSAGSVWTGGSPLPRAGNVVLAEAPEPDGGFAGWVISLDVAL